MTAEATTEATTVGGRVPRARAPHTRTATLGLALIGAAPLFMIAAALVAGQDMGETLGFLGPIAVIAAIGAGLVWRFGTWSKVLGIVLTLGAAFMMFWAVFGLAYPAAIGDFVPGVLFPVGVALALVGNIVAIVRRRRPAIAASAAERRVARVALGAVGLAVVVSGALSVAGRTTVDEAAAAAATPVTMKDFEFSAETFEVAGGGEVFVRNSDGFVHTFTVPELGIDEVLTPGSEKLITIDGDPGIYTLYCKPHSDLSEPDPEAAGMAAQLVIE